jgi:acetolactate synthase-1/2/3 large subunit
MNGAQFFMSTLASNGVSVCFANPGTSELHLVEAIDSTEGMRGVLTLFEGVATGAADGYGRMADRPAAVLLHLGPGLANGLANLHNARRAGSPVICIVGEQALYHRKYDPPLNMLSSIESLASSVSAVVLTPMANDEKTLEGIVSEAINFITAGDADTASKSGLYSEVATSFDSGDADYDSDYIATRATGRVATIIMPANISWTDTSPSDVSPVYTQNTSVKELNDDVIQTVAGLLGSGDKTCLLLGGRALREHPIRTVAHIASLTGVRLFAETLPARIQRGGSIPSIDRLGYLPEIAIDQLSGIENLILVDTPAPVSFFAYESVPSSLAPSGCRVISIASGFDDIEGTLDSLSEMVSKLYDTPSASDLASATTNSESVGSSDAFVESEEGKGGKAQGTDHIGSHVVDHDHDHDHTASQSTDHAYSSILLPSGKLDSDTLGRIFGALLPENAIVVDEGVSEGIWPYIHSVNSPVHDWLCLSGGAIGQGMPLSIGVAIACPDRKVINLEADGSAMYTIQSLWTQSRESLDVVTIILANRSYQLLQIEMDRMNIDRSGESASGLTGIASPEIDYVGLARSMGVSAVKVDDADTFAAAFSEALSTHGPYLVEAILS